MGGGELTNSVAFDKLAGYAYTLTAIIYLIMIASRKL